VATGSLKNFVIEPFVAHRAEEEYYLCMYQTRTANVIMFYHEGGVDVGDVDAKAVKLELDVEDVPTPERIRQALLAKASREYRER
jgi:ATP citrate (pro-S)-lyase